MNKKGRTPKKQKSSKEKKEGRRRVWRKENNPPDSCSLPDPFTLQLTAPKTCSLRRGKTHERERNLNGRFCQSWTWQFSALFGLQLFGFYKGKNVSQGQEKHKKWPKEFWFALELSSTVKPRSAGGNVPREGSYASRGTIRYWLLTLGGKAHLFALQK